MKPSPTEARSSRINRHAKLASDPIQTYTRGMGAFLVIVSAFGFSTLGVFGKFAYLAGFTRNQMLFFRFLISLPILAVILAVTGTLPKDSKAYGKAILLGMIGIGIEATLYFLTLEELGASLTGVFLYLYPAFVVLLSHFFLKQRSSLGKWLCVGLALLGCVLTVDPTGDKLSTLGIIWGVLTGLWYGIYLLIGERLTHDQNPLTVSSGIVLGAAIAFGVLAAFDYLALPMGADYIPYPDTVERLWPILGLALFASVLPFTTLYAGMKRVGASQASILSTSELVFTIVLAALFLDEKLTPIQIVGSGLVLGSVLLIQKVK